MAYRLMDAADATFFQDRLLQIVKMLSKLR
jgi:hypothetical protein